MMHQAVAILLTLFVALLVPIYWRAYGLQNFLWFSDIGLFLTLLALWTKSRLLMSIAVLETCVLELLWNGDFLGILLFKKSSIKLADYMFDSQYSLSLRSLSLFHVFMPLLWIYYLAIEGYDPDAIYYAIPLMWFILLITYLVSDPSQNINWAFHAQKYNLGISSRAWLLFLMLGLPSVTVLPTHYLLLRVSVFKDDLVSSSKSG